MSILASLCNMSLAGFDVPPSGALIQPTPFTFSVPQSSLDDLATLVKASPIAPETFYTTHNISSSPSYPIGPSREWIQTAASIWIDSNATAAVGSDTDTGDKFNWRTHEARMNAIPQFKINVTAPSTGQVFNLHFGALFSRNPNGAVPILISHGWPSAWTEFIPILELLKDKYTPETLPYHVIAPSIPDYGLSTRSNATGLELNFDQAAEALNELMKALGFGEKGYVAQGGDVGAGITAALGANFDEVKAVHFNNLLANPVEIAEVLALNLTITPEEAATLALGQSFISSGSSYMLEQGTKPATISHALMSSPIAMLAWLGQMYTEAAGVNYSFNWILGEVSWYWHTRSYSSSLWAYRAVWEPVLKGLHLERLPSPLKITEKPFGFSGFPFDVITPPRSWIEHWFKDNLVFYRAHKSGGHFAALDEPEEFLQDLEEFVGIVKTKVDFGVKGDAPKV
ncbi:putative epoxide hydrolase [Rhypophila decipiens]